MKSFSFTKKTEGNKAFLFIAKLKVIPGKSSVLPYKKSKQKENRTEGNKGTHIKGIIFFTKEICPYYCRFLHAKKDSGGASIHRINE